MTDTQDAGDRGIRDMAGNPRMSASEFAKALEMQQDAGTGVRCTRATGHSGDHEHNPGDDYIFPCNAAMLGAVGKLGKLTDAGAGERPRWRGDDERLTNGKVSYRVYHPDDLNLADYLNALEDRVQALQKPNYRCDVGCDAFHWGGSCRCSELFQELPAANDRVQAAEQRIKEEHDAALDVWASLEAEAELRLAVEQQLREAKANWWEENTDKEHLKMFQDARYWCHFCRQTGVFPDAIKHAPKCFLTASPAQPTEES